MKSKQILIRIFTVASFILLPVFCLAQYPIGNILNQINTTSVPFNATKTTAFVSGQNYWIVNPNNIIPDKLYNNFQLTQYDNASIDPAGLGGTTFRKFAISNSANYLLVVAFGGVSDWETDVMCVVNATGQILSTLECAVYFYSSGTIAAKQFRINAQNQIIVTTIKPTSTVSVPFGTFTSFTGYRQDITYSVNAQGQFVQNSVQNYQSKTYTRSYLENKSNNIWNGGETPI